MHAVVHGGYNILVRSDPDPDPLVSTEQARAQSCDCDAPALHAWPKDTLA